MAFESSDMMLVMVILLSIVFVIGIFFLFAGIFILLNRSFSSDIRTLATQTNQLAQKGVIDDIAGLVGNASALMDATNQLVKTTTGIGAFLIIVGLIMISGSVYFLMRLV